VAADHWDRLAAESERMAAWDRSIGIDLSVGTSAGDHRARTYRRAAECSRLEAETGLRHCHCHALPKCPIGSR